MAALGGGVGPWTWRSVLVELERLGTLGLIELAGAMLEDPRITITDKGRRLLETERGQ